MSQNTPGPGGPAAVSRRTVTASAVLATALTALGGTTRARARAGAGTGAEGGDVVPRLPAPTGPYRIGAVTLHLVDRSRRDPWDPGIPVRELMVTVFYPARTVRAYPRAPHMTPGAARSFAELAPAMRPQLPRAGVDWAATTTHAHLGAPALPVPRPVLLYSPGGGDPRTLGTALAEELASRGHVVVAMDHPGDASEVEFPAPAAYRDGVLRQTVFTGDPRTDPALFRTVIGTRVADTRFVLDRLAELAAGRNPDAAGRALPLHLGRALDLRRVGIYGHSAGGTAAAQALYEDARLVAAANLEGYLDHPAEAPGREGELFPVARDGVDRPLLLLGTDGFTDRKALERSWSAMLAHPRGRTVRRQLDGAAHGVFTDYAAFAPLLQAVGLMTAEGRAELVGALDPAVSVPAVRHHVAAFFGRHLGARRAQ
ncbi:alpha/beta hydrolase [Streptomyces sp. NPDC045431]|uniref:alpha/beta hydrolase family protein n=1 Tax=Streptomyces sp. NPDC045431 TaxID=3155613 RepID=UPI0033CB1268